MGVRGDATIDNGKLTSRKLVGDRVRLREGVAKNYTDVYSFNPNEIRTIIRADKGSNGERLWVEGAPHMFWANDVELAWNTEDERRKALRAAGWTA